MNGCFRGRARSRANKDRQDRGLQTRVPRKKKTQNLGCTKCILAVCCICLPVSTDMATNFIQQAVHSRCTVVPSAGWSPCAGSRQHARPSCTRNYVSRQMCGECIHLPYPLAISAAAREEAQPRCRRCTAFCQLTTNDDLRLPITVTQHRVGQAEAFSWSQFVMTSSSAGTFTEAVAESTNRQVISFSMRWDTI